MSSSGVAPPTVPPCHRDAGPVASSLLVPQVLAAQEAERARIARDLHDQVGQSLTSVLLALRLADLALVAPDPDVPNARRRLEQTRELLTDTLRDVRELAFELRPPVLDDLGLAVALERLTVRAAETAKFGLTLSLDGLDGQRLPADVEIAAYRIVQEALSNVARHARAQQVHVTAKLSRDRLRIEVADDGVGFDPDVVQGGALGLQGMRERAALVNAHVRVDTRRPIGTTVVVEVPL